MDYIKAVDGLYKLKHQIENEETPYISRYDYMRRFISTFVSVRTKIEKKLILKTRGYHSYDESQIDLTFDLEDVNYFLEKYECKAKEQAVAEAEKQVKVGENRLLGLQKNIQRDKDKAEALKKEIC